MPSDKTVYLIHKRLKLVAGGSGSAAVQALQRRHQLVSQTGGRTLAERAIRCQILDATDQIANAILRRERRAVDLKRAPYGRTRVERPRARGAATLRPGERRERYVADRVPTPPGDHTIGAGCNG